MSGGTKFSSEYCPGGHVKGGTSHTRTTALHGVICQWCVLIDSKSNVCPYEIIKINNYYYSVLSVRDALRTAFISSADMAPGRSCLLANTSSVAPANLCPVLVSRASPSYPKREKGSQHCCKYQVSMVPSLARQPLLPSLGRRGWRARLVLSQVPSPIEA